ncbi:hypothetical protein [Flavihumibacter fluvii]|uniref:baeRF3 domain-containing protein n=1 Tax=Flavihumibacter fluvii TaxID=2838157 RepID=UPI001BDE9751|nr:hypothetical protein [Flavihumibacter fluvii]ULQ52476.1 hypothetical protein KJS93_20520 [Flavihumibacter fluvii]
MLNDKLPGEDLLAMQKETNKPCISIIIPTHKLSPDRRVDKLAIERAIESAREYLEFKYGTEKAKSLLQKLNDLFQAIDFTRNSNGIGLFVSESIKLKVHFPFEVKEKVIIGDNFEYRELLYNLSQSTAFFAIQLSQKSIRLFEGAGNQVIEIKDINFPKEYSEEYVYAHPTNSSSLAGYAHEKGFEKDKSELEEIRFREFFREGDEALKNYLVNNTPLIVIGVEKELAWFEDITKHGRHIIGKIKGNHGHSSEKQYSDLTWPVMESYLKRKNQDLIREFSEKIGAHLGISGIQDVWKAAKEGKGYKLLVEKDYRCPGFLDNNEYHLLLHPPDHTHKILPDAVDDLIETILSKNGEVYFTENGSLGDYQRIALITRY